MIHVMRSKDPESIRASAVHLAWVLLRDRATGSAPESHYRRLLAMVVWRWSEAYGKYSDRLPWSRGARHTMRRDSLRHEHVVPRKVLIAELCALRSPTRRNIRELLERLGLACVVTQEEHEQLPNVSAAILRADPWARYRAAGIRVLHPPKAR